jgi:hypothetical protein
MWDLDAGEPSVCDLKEAQLRTLDPMIEDFARRKGATVEINDHNYPRRHIVLIGSDDVRRKIEIIPTAVPGDPDTRPTGRFWIQGVAGFDEGTTRWLFWYPPSSSKERQADLPELQRNLTSRLESIWAELESCDRPKIMRLGCKSRLGA